MTPFEVLLQYRRAFTDGALVTLELFSLSLILGTAIGGVLCIAARKLPSVLRPALDLATFCITAIPALIILFWFHFPMQAIFNVVLPPFLTALATLIVLNAFAVYRMLQEALDDFPRQYVQAALVCGMSRHAIVKSIQTPILTRLVLPRWIDQQVVILQSTVFASLISVEEIFRTAQRVNSQVYHPVAIYTAMGLVFLITTGPLLLLARALRARFFRDLSER